MRAKVEGRPKYEFFMIVEKTYGFFDSVRKNRRSFPQSLNSLSELISAWKNVVSRVESSIFSTETSSEKKFEKCIKIWVF